MHCLVGMVKPLFMVATLGVILWPCAAGQGSRISAEVEFARGKEGWTTTGPLPGLRDSSLTVWTDPGESWHFVSPRGFAFASPCLYGGSLSFTMGHSVLMPGQPQQQPSGRGGRDQRRARAQPKNPDLYDALLASTKGITLGATLGVRAYEEGNYSASLSAGAWQDAETGGNATGLEVRDVLSSLEAVMIRGSRLGGGRQAEAVWVRRVALSGPEDGSCDEPLSSSPSPPPSLKKDDDAMLLDVASKSSRASAGEQGNSGRNITPPTPARDEKACGELFDAREWKKALSCYMELPPSQGGCWRYLREARLGTMLRKPAVNETMEMLRSAIGADGANGECSAWAHRTRGDVLFRSQDFKDAAKAWKEAQVPHALKMPNAHVIHKVLKITTRHVSQNPENSSLNLGRVGVASTPVCGSALGQSGGRAHVRGDRGRRQGGVRDGALGDAGTTSAAGYGYDGHCYVQGGGQSDYRGKAQVPRGGQGGVHIRVAS